MVLSKVAEGVEKGRKLFVQDERRPHKYLVQHFSVFVYQIALSSYKILLRHILKINNVFVCACMCVCAREWMPTYCIWHVTDLGHLHQFPDEKTEV